MLLQKEALIAQARPRKLQLMTGAVTCRIPGSLQQQQQQQQQLLLQSLTQSTHK